MMGFGLWKVDTNHILGRSADFLTKDVSKTSPSSGVSPGNPGPGRGTRSLSQGLQQMPEVKVVEVVDLLEKLGVTMALQQKSRRVGTS